MSCQLILFKCLKRGRFWIDLVCKGWTSPPSMVSSREIAISMRNSIDLNMGHCHYADDLVTRTICSWINPATAIVQSPRPWHVCWLRDWLWPGWGINYRYSIRALPMFPLDIFSRTWGTKPGTGKWKIMTWCCSQWGAAALCHTNHDDSN